MIFALYGSNILFFVKGLAELRTVHYETDLCVVGGGLSGLCCAIAAARHGIKTVLVHDRSVLMHICIRIMLLLGLEIENRCVIMKKTFGLRSEKYGYSVDWQ